MSCSYRSSLDSLAGRMGILRRIRSRSARLAGRPSRFLDALFAGTSAPALPRGSARYWPIGWSPAAIRQLARRTPARRGAWYRDYVETQIQRDVRDLSRIRSLDALWQDCSLWPRATPRICSM